MHPGYGFVSQSAAFVEACVKAGLSIFIGPSAKAMQALGDKRGSRELAEKASVPVVPGEKIIENPKPGAGCSPIALAAVSAQSLHV